MPLLGKILGGNLLYYPGCLYSTILQERSNKYLTLLREIGYDPIMLEDAKCCGSPLLSSGMRNLYEEIAERNRSLFEEHRVERIVSPCPSCVENLRNQGHKAVHITVLLTEKRSFLKPSISPCDVSFHDPCHLARSLRTTDEPRQILAHLGFNVVEPEYCGVFTLCCGGGGGVKARYSEMSLEMARRRLEGFHSKYVVTSCPMCLLNLEEANRKFSLGKKIYDLIDLIST